MIKKKTQTVHRFHIWCITWGNKLWKDYQNFKISVLDDPDYNFLLMKWEGSTGTILWNYGQRAARSIQKWLRANFSTVQLDQARLASSLTQCIWYLHQTCFFFLIASISKNRYTSHDHIRWYVWQNLDHVRTNWNPQIYLRAGLFKRG